ncbi:3-keto-disaccharide hydrolase [Chitinophaga caseinilytica]|uniref:3-keto-disaccharide hydrolase n=1 Tax=Chitinophaga caseinilytica TaxID=2267521 RepID=UPI003C2B88D6
MRQMKVNPKSISIAAIALLFMHCGGNAPASEAAEGSGFASIFNGKNLEGWDGDTAHWRVENGILTGEITPEKPLSRNTFIIWKGGQPADFELKTQFRITADGNSGINYRSDVVPDEPHALRGYQADIDAARAYLGQNYDEYARTTLAYRGQRVTVPAADIALKAGIRNNAWAPVQVTGTLGDDASLKSVYKPNEWNEYRVVAKGNKLQHFVNGTLLSEVTDEDTANRKLKGWLGLQVHVGPPMKVEFRDILLKQ